VDFRFGKEGRNPNLPRRRKEINPNLSRKEVCFGEEVLPIIRMGQKRNLSQRKQRKQRNPNLPEKKGNLPKEEVQNIIIIKVMEPSS